MHAFSPPSRILSTILTAGTCVSGLMLVFTPLWSREPLWDSIGYGLTLVLHLFHLWLVSRGHALAAARSFSILFFVMITTMVYAYGGVRGLGPFVYPLAALFAGLTWSAWAAVGVAIAASAATLAMALAENEGLMSAVPPTPSAGGAWAVVTASVVMTAVMLFVALRVIRQSNAEAIESERQRRVLEVELARAKRMEALGQLASGVAHDFNNMLTGMIGHAELIELKSHQGSDVARHAGLVLSAGDKAARLARELLTFARKRDDVIEDVRINDVIANVVAILERSVAPSIRIRAELDAKPGIVHGDGARIEMALLNLALNARDALPNGGDVLFRTSSLRSQDDGRHAWVRVDVTDTGVGMPDDVREHVFEPYFTTKPPGRGTGLGLSAVYGTVKNLGGTIDVVSREGSGSTFSIRLPAASGLVARPDAVARDPTVVRRLSILAIDDDIVVLDLLRGLLEGMGHAIETAASGEDGLARFDAHARSFDLVILDWVMPGISGPELLETLEARDPRAVPIIVTSGAMDELPQSSEIYDNVRFLAKPYRRADLEKTTAELTAESTARVH